MQTECGLTGGPVGRSFPSSREVAILIIIPYGAVHSVIYRCLQVQKLYREAENALCVCVCVCVCVRACVRVFRRQLFVKVLKDKGEFAGQMEVEDGVF